VAVNVVDTRADDKGLLCDEVLERALEAGDLGRQMNEKSRG